MIHSLLLIFISRPHFSLDVRTRASEGLLFFAATRGGRAHLVLYISKGRIRLSVGREKEIFNREKYNDGKWHSVSEQKIITIHSKISLSSASLWDTVCWLGSQIIFSLEKKKFRLVVDGIRAQDGQLTQSELTSMQLFLSPVYLGAAPETFHKELKVRRIIMIMTLIYIVQILMVYILGFSQKAFQSKVSPAASAISKWTAHRCSILRQITVLDPALRERRKEELISQGMELMSSSVSTNSHGWLQKWQLLGNIFVYFVFHTPLKRHITK